MEMKSLLDFIDRSLSEQGKWTFYHDQDMTKRIFAGALKLTEEVGELNAEILWHTWFIRQEKSMKYSPETLKDEFADGMAPKVSAVLSALNSGAKSARIFDGRQEENVISALSGQLGTLVHLWVKIF